MWKSNRGEYIPEGSRMAGRYSEIVLSFVIVTIPMLTFTAALLGLVFHYRVTHNGAVFENLDLTGTRDEAGIYYVNLNSTLLIFIASWSSSLAPILAGFVLALASYPIARGYLRDSRTERSHQLPSPYQLALILKFLNGGGLGALWTWLKYLAGWRQRRERQSNSLTSTASVAILATVLAVIVFLADTWLHISTKTAPFVQITPVSNATDYSLVLLPDCTAGNNSFKAQFANPCSLSIAATNIFLINGSQSLQVLNNVSQSMSVLTYESDPPCTYLGIPPSEVLSQRDYTATTFGMQTKCRPISTECNLIAYDGASTLFKCNSAFSGSVSENLIMPYFTDATLSSNDTSAGIQNPYYFGLATVSNSEGGGTLAENSTSVPEIVGVVHGGIAFVLGCSVTVYNVEYDSVNGTVTRFVTAASNDSTANIWQTTMAQTNVGNPYLQQAASLAAFSDSAQELADKIALAYSKVALAIGAQAVMPHPALAAQERTSSLVARVPLAPLFTLVTANLLFVALGFVLTGIALGTSGGEVRDVQARLSIVGLVADRFEALRARRRVGSVDELFEENDGHGSMRVEIHREAQGGYFYNALPKAT